MKHEAHGAQQHLHINEIDDGTSTAQRDVLLSQSTNQRLLSHPAWIALIIQLVALLIISTAATAQTTFIFNLFEWGIVQGLVAGMISAAVRMPAWWIFIHLGFIPLVLIMLTVDISPSWYLALFLGLLLIYGKSFKTQVPLYLSSKKAHHALVSILPGNNRFSFVDLGCGCGGLLTALADNRRNGVFHGIESAPLPFLISKIRCLFDPSCSIRWGDFWQQDFSHYDVVYAYLSPVPMTRLWQKAKKEMRPGSLLISNTFMIPGVKPYRRIRLNDFSNSTLYLWKL